VGLFIGLLAVLGAIAIGFVWLVWAALSALFG
jgi:hypothetical protein